MKRLFLSSIAILALGGIAASQVNTVPQVGLITGILANSTYTASTVGIAPASSATDFFCVNGSTSKNVHVKRFLISGTAGTAISTPILVNLNHSLDSGGTSPSSGLTQPVPVPLNTNNVAATATTLSYTANPTVNDTAPNLLVVASPTFQVTTTANGIIEIRAGSAVAFFNQAWDIPKAGTVVQQICLNLNGVSISSGKVNVTAEWTED
jgi:hypothetical protein